MGWVRAGGDDAVPVEEQVWDRAADVAYAGHAGQDFYRTGLIPLAVLFPSRGPQGVTPSARHSAFWTT
ncbi:hypothetical protein GCM10010245_66250 [Streptomyces spectabilis]|nr:hypothetical protein GCM10010245_66250 [Streptomyces spectabilis]